MSFDAAALPKANFDDEILRQQEQIKEEINRTQPYISEKQDLLSLLSEFEGNDIYSTKTKSLGQQYRQIRRTRRDGNCFFRAFGFAFLEYMMQAHDDVIQGAVTMLKMSSPLLEMYYSSFVFEDYLEMLVEELQQIKTRDEAYLLQFFQEFSNAESIVLILRFLTSVQLRNHSDEYIGFLPPGFIDIAQFCSSEVETMGKESDELHIVALATFFQLNLRVAYLDQSKSDLPNFHDFNFASNNGEAIPHFHLLYRPGHYDLIYK